MPATGPAGANVTITGLNFTTVTAGKFGAVIAKFTYVSDSQIVAIVPPTAGNSAISVTTSKGTVSSGAKVFTVIKAPTISSISPLLGTVGTTVTIFGANLGTVTLVKFTGANPVAPISKTATSLKVNVPVNATTGKVMVTNPAGTFLSTAIFKVMPKITAFTPISALPGESITITGVSFTGVTSVKFGTVVVSPTDFRVDSDTQITVKVPATAVTGKVSLVTKDGTILSTIDFTVIRQPTISSFSPTSGRAGTVVVIAGTNLTSVTEVKFGSMSAGVPSPGTGSSIKITVPQGIATGKMSISVSNQAGTATSLGTFTVLP